MTNIGYTPEEPIAAIATALAPGAIGIVRTSGKDCIKLFAPLFSRKDALLNAEGNSLVYGWILDPKTNAFIDEVMLGVYRSPKSFTGEDMVEIFCHGGVSVVTAVLNLLLANGFRQAERGEYTFRAYINGKADLTKAEAVKEIIDSKTDYSRSRATLRLAGDLFTEIDQIKNLVVDTLASLEVEIEYPEDEETISDTFDKQKLLQAQKRLQTLVASWKSEKLYQDGATIVLCGKTNAGKSSLFNALLKEERAIVSDIEGTTRDWLESWVSFDGIPAKLFDTAGLRKTQDTIEAVGVERTKDISKAADVILYLVDSSKGIQTEDIDFIAQQKDIPAILVWNKCDKENALLPPDIKNAPWKTFVQVSAKKSIGLDLLSASVKNIVLAGSSSERAQAGLGSDRQKKAVTEALERVTHAIKTAEDAEYGLDAVVQDLEDSIDFLGEVTGKIMPDDVLGSIFSHFCVGK